MMMPILTTMFIITMALNLVAFARHFMMMRAMGIVLGKLIETQRQFIELTEAQELPDEERAAVIKAIVERYR
jgi:hypothetical protein